MPVPGQFNCNAFNVRTFVVFGLITTLMTNHRLYSITLSVYFYQS